jgi:hypothetical protein
MNKPEHLSPDNEPTMPTRISSPPERIRPQVDHLMDLLEEVNKGRKYPRPPEEYKFLRNFAERYIDERWRRSIEVESEEVREAADIANKLFPYPLYGVMCIDGRDQPPLVAGMMAKFGGFMRLPAADLKEFVMGRDGHLTLIRDSHYARQTDLTMKKHDVKVELLGSHVACAARKDEEIASTGLTPDDDGLMVDVERKKEIGIAARNYVDKMHPGKKLIPMQFSFDVHNGYGYMGLENDEALKFAHEHGGYTHDVLHHLFEQGKIISTEKLVKLGEVNASFKKWATAFELNAKDAQGNLNFDWANNYKGTALGFWKAMNAMKPELMPVIKDEILEIYPHLRGKEEDKQKEVEERAMFIMANTFSGYLNNLDPNGEEGKGKYKYAAHDESCVVVTEREHGPFAGDNSFIVFSLDLKNMPHHVRFASGIVRDNRRAGRIKDKNYESKEELSDYIKSPGPVVVHEIIRDDIDPKDWQMLENVDWSDLEEVRWRDLSTQDFLDYLTKKLPHIPLPLALGIDRLRQKMTFLYNPEKESAKHFIEGNLAAIPMVVDRNRCPHAIIPFVKRGFHV